MLECALFRVREMGEYSALYPHFPRASRNNFSSFVRASSSVPSLFISFFLEVHSKFANILACKNANQKHNFFRDNGQITDNSWIFHKGKKRKVLRKPLSKHLSVTACSRIRTRDLLVRSQTLYPAELCTHKRVKGIGPSYLAWKASVLPLNYTRML